MDTSTLADMASLQFQGAERLPNEEKDLLGRFFAHVLNKSMENDFEDLADRINKSQLFFFESRTNTADVDQTVSADHVPAYILESMQNFSGAPTAVLQAIGATAKDVVSRVIAPVGSLGQQLHLSAQRFQKPSTHTAEGAGHSTGQQQRKRADSRVQSGAQEVQMLDLKNNAHAVTPAYLQIKEIRNCIVANYSVVGSGEIVMLDLYQYRFTFSDESVVNPTGGPSPHSTSSDPSSGHGNGGVMSVRSCKVEGQLYRFSLNDEMYRANARQLQALLPAEETLKKTLQLESRSC
ncbi:hypothetical protein HK097_010258 [Rhizophlyctis rosea]|uniref:Uncharacterized protein n=1 Tax=Rhizophlyctis rosea TaxID=64517 RepID=A0AAD5X2N4_9FUNG|nr:hypothetical protein HK097_010258 [Rhizophlyctis rosea]